MIIHDVEQRSDEWYALRLGRLTGSWASDMQATIKKGEAAGRRNLRIRLVLEQLTGTSQENGYESADMRRGRELEEEALLAYEALTGLIVRRVGFVSHDSLMAGASPDGFVGDVGTVEAKCPKSATHLDYLRARRPPGEYYWQCVHGLWVSEREWCDFVSYDPRFPEAQRLLLSRIYLDDAQRKAYELLVRMFLAEVDREREEVAGLDMVTSLVVSVPGPVPA